MKELLEFGRQTSTLRRRCDRLGVPFYGYDFGVDPVESFNYRGIVAQDPANAFLDNTGQKWWNGIPTIKAKTELALDKVAGTT